MQNTKSDALLQLQARLDPASIEDLVAPIIYVSQLMDATSQARPPSPIRRTNNNTYYRWQHVNYVRYRNRKLHHRQIADK